MRRLVCEREVEVYGADIGANQRGGFLAAYFRVDVDDREQVDRAIREAAPDWVFSLAGVAQGNTDLIYRVNLIGSINLLESVKQYAPDARVVMVGTAAEYGFVEENELPIVEDTPCRPSGHYGISKLAMTQAALCYANQFGLNVSVARPFNIVGPGIPTSLVLGAVLERARRALAEGGEVVTVGNVDTERDFIAVDDVVDAYVSMARSNCRGEVYNICSGEPRRIRDVIELALARAPRRLRLKIDQALVRASDPRRLYGSYEKAERSFGFRPRVRIDDSIAAAWDSYMRTALRK